ncbi:MAG: BrxA/BrxB family bacilliredoxin [Ignavibacteriales bacterium]|nr:BrxA/BrxB family bacilliredoxin [Ignavibacteriales bacterium]
MYDPVMIQPFRDELTDIGFKELMTPEEVDATISSNKGTLLVVVNSVCGCAAGKARPGIRKALQHTVKPDNLVSVFAGQEKEATARLRERWLQGIPPSSPSIALYKDNELVHFIPRFKIEGRIADEIAADLVSAFDEFCGDKVTA